MRKHIFISYSRKDAKSMRTIRKVFERFELPVWTDEGIRVGTSSWRDTIQNAIENAFCVVVLLSPSAKNSKWVKTELDFADLQEVRIFPILIKGDEKTSIPFALASTHYANLRKNPKEEMKHLINAGNELRGQFNTNAGKSSKKTYLGKISTWVLLISLDEYSKMPL